MQDLTLSLVQADLLWEDPAGNRARLADQLAVLPRTDVIVLPEMFSTGFSMNAAALAEPMDGPSVAWLLEQARRTDALVGGSLIIREDGRYYNRFVLAQPDGRLHHYDKRHTFRMAREHEVYTSGQDRLILLWRGWRILPLVCYDLRFPVWSRNRLADPVQGYDLALYVANWPAARNRHWQQLLAARAIENQSYVAGVNRCGTDGNQISYSGNTALYDFHGEILAGVSPHAPGQCTGTLSAQALQSWRDRFPAWQDADAFGWV
ncbi:MAG: amidohydrolase [Bacteroidetes bacterium]|nr:amidohydrolase [Bacteroidota bacterium]